MSSSYQTQRYLNFRDVGLVDNSGNVLKFVHPGSSGNLTFPYGDVTLASTSDLSGYITNPLTSDLNITNRNIVFDSGSASITDGSNNYLQIFSSGETSALTIVTSGTSSTAMQLNANNGGISLNSGNDSNFTLASTANGQDLTLSLTGNYDSSVLISSSGTGTDAVGISTTTGDISISSARNIAYTSSQDSTISSTSGNVIINASSGYTKLMTNTQLYSGSLTSTTNTTTVIDTINLTPCKAYELETKVLVHDIQEDSVTSYKIESAFQTGLYSKVNFTAVTVNTTNDTIRLNTGFGSYLTQKQKIRVVRPSNTSGVTFDSGGGALNYTDDALDLYVNSISGDDITFSSTAGGPQLTITTAGNGSSTTVMTPGNLVTFSYSDVNTGTGEITLPQATCDILDTGSKVIYSAYSGTKITELTEDAVYWIIKSSSTTIKLASSQQNSFSDTEITLNSQGTGTQALYLETKKVATDIVTVKGSSGTHPVSVVAAGTTLGDLKVAITGKSPNSSGNAYFDAKVNMGIVAV